jgi:hypothetical protein
MAVVVLAGLVLVCGFFLYVLVQFRRDEKHLRRHEESPTGFPIVASGQIVGPLPDRNGHRFGNAALQKDARGNSNRRNIS